MLTCIIITFTLQTVFTDVFIISTELLFLSMVYNTSFAYTPLEDWDMHILCHVKQFQQVPIVHPTFEHSMDPHCLPVRDGFIF